ncbi:MAG: ABC transporter substrate-binding protein [Patescibacteria group bacterium]|jgi:peptide/nickel transport system substrate-binding protein
MSAFRDRFSKIFKRTSHSRKDADFHELQQEREDRHKELMSRLGAARTIPTPAQISMVGRVLSPRELTIIRFLVGLFFVSIIVLGVRFVGRHIETVPKPGGSYTEALVGIPQYINPIFSPANDVDEDLETLIYSSLFTFDENFGLISDLVSTWEVSEDQKTYTINLREDVRFHDGEQLTADDVIFTLEMIQDEQVNSPLHTTFRGLNIERLGDFQIRITLNEVFAPFLSSLTFGILPEHLWVQVPISNLTLVEFNLKPIGSGPYQFDQLTRDQQGNVLSYGLIRNEDYHGMSPYIEKLTFRFYPDFTTAIEAARQKKVQGISFIPSDLRNEVEDIDRMRVESLHLPQYTALFFNQKKQSILADDTVRIALALGIDRERLIREVVGGDGEIIDSPILPGFLGYNPEIKKRLYEPDEARRILTDTGWLPDPETDIRFKGDKELKLVITTVDQSSTMLAAEIVAENWRNIGVNVEIRKVETRRIQKDAIESRDYEVLLFGEIIGADPDPYAFWHSSQQTHPGLNLAISFNKQIDKVIEQARTTTSADERNLKYLEFQNLLAEDLPAIFLYSPNYLYGISKSVHGFPLQSIIVPQDRFRGIEEWYVKTQLEWV